MSTTRDEIAQLLERLPEDELEMVKDFVSVLLLRTAMQSLDGYELEKVKDFVSVLLRKGQDTSPKRRCPICAEHPLPDDLTIADRIGNTVVLQGRVNAVVHPGEANYSPFADYCTIPLYPRRGTVKYLKFRTSQEMDQLGLERNDQIQVEGCLHTVNGYELIFDVRKVQKNPLR